MAETLIKCSQGTANAIIGSLILAASLKGHGEDVAVAFSQDALVAFAEKEFPYSPLMAKYADIVEKNSKNVGFPMDPMEALKIAKEAGVPVYACGPCAYLLGVKEKLPDLMTLLEADDEVTLNAEARKVIG